MKNLCDFNLKKDNPWRYFLIFWILLSVQITSFLFLADINDFGMPSTILIGCIDALTILSPYLLLRPKWRWAVAIPMVIIPIFLYANLLYLRNFNDLMGFTTMFGVSNLNGEVTSSAMTYVKAKDLPIILPLILFIIIFACRYRHITSGKFCFLQKAWGLIIILSLFFLQQIFLTYRFNQDYNLSNTPPYNPMMSEKCYYKKLAKKERKYSLEYYGFLPYLIVQTIEFFSPKYETLTDAERADIKVAIQEVNRQMPLLDSIPDNSRKNLILIVVESLNTDALKLTANGKPIMPFMNYLLKQDSIILMENVMAQVGTGRSSDGRFIYQTGILPLPNDPVAMSYTDARYPSLSEALGRKGHEFDCGNPIQWNKVELSKSYGFDTLVTQDQLSKGMKQLGGRDVAMFNNAIPIIKTLPTPFYAALNTMDMHDPYQEFGWKKSDAWKDPAYSLTEHVYIEKCRQFDAGLSQFVAALKREGLYDNSVIVIAGDHNAREAALDGNKFVNTNIPILILNSGIDLRSDKPIGQIDLYPTLLDVMGVEDYKWRGVGTSALRNPSILSNDGSSTAPDAYTYPSEQAWMLSERLIRSGYYRR